MRAPINRPLLWTVAGLGAAGIAGLAGGGLWRRHSIHPAQKPVGLEERASKRVELMPPPAPPPQPEMRYPLGLAAAILILMVLIVAIVWWFDHLRHVQQEANLATGGVGGRAIPIMLANGCAGCHTIPGVPGAQGLAGPKLDSTLNERLYLGGNVPNTSQNMIQWIRFSRQLDPHTAMPSTGISEQDARDIAAYLYALR